MASVWLATGLDALGDEEGARQALAVAGSIYPDNWWLEEVAVKLHIELD